MADSLEATLAVAVATLARLEKEQGEHRKRLHRLESTARGVVLLRKDVAELHTDLPNLARQAARDAVTEYNARKHAQRFSDWRTYAAILSAGIAAGAFIVALALGHV